MNIQTYFEAYLKSPVPMTFIVLYVLFVAYFTLFILKKTQCTNCKNQGVCTEHSFKSRFMKMKLSFNPMCFIGQHKNGEKKRDKSREREMGEKFR